MIIKNKLKFYKPSEIKNILDELYSLNYSESHVYKRFMNLNATFKIGQAHYVLEEFIQYLFTPNMKDSYTKAQVIQKIVERKKIVLENIKVEQLRFKALRIKKQIDITDQAQRKQIQEQQKSELIKKIKKNKCIIY
ncbi:hypothetical protein [Candidatus Borreliella tachyglossi]|uniref:hypothetical protein n=1 Tax=Candidatus Borreliella tachyglossi TaxID=1964448 RepID=UPI004041BE48